MNRRYWEGNITSQELLEKQQNAIRIFKKSFQDIIREACGLATGEGFKTKISIQEIIDYKHPKAPDEYKFKLYISAIDYIIVMTKAHFPFIDLTGIYLSWTPEQIFEYVLDMFYTIKPLTIEDIDKLRELNGVYKLHE